MRGTGWKTEKLESVRKPDAKLGSQALLRLVGGAKVSDNVKENRHD